MDYQTDPMDDLNNQPPGHLSTPGQKSPRSRKKLTAVIIVAVVAILGLGAAAFFLLKGNDDTPGQGTANQQNQNTEEENEEPTLPPAEAAQPQAHKSEALKLEFTHRKDWTVRELSEEKQIIATSPKFTYQTKDGESVKGVFTLKLGIGATADAQKTIDNSQTVRDSLLIGYDAPTEEQRHYTNITYAGPEEATFAFLIVTGSDAFKPGDPLAGRVVIHDTNYLIAGGFGADGQNSLTFDTIDLADLEQHTAYEQAVAIVKSLKVF